jgi:D-arabinose 1-dehydrogenase-like Zn-dependent alcohol dehydrogenase
VINLHQEFEMPKMRVAQVPAPNAPLEIVERDIPEPAADEVLIKVEACGVCHSDSMTKEGLWPGLAFPRVPGHEVVGTIDAVGPGVANLSIGQRVGVGWHAWHCLRCDNCRRGDFFACQAGAKVTGIHFDGGYAEYMVAPALGVARMPDDLGFVEAAPLMCAGITTFNALRNSGARPGDTVAILGIGGLGHLGVQFAAKMGFNTIAIARGGDKEPLARELGAHHYIDSQAGNPSEALKQLGGAKVVLATLTHGDAMAATIGGLQPNGTLMILGAAESMHLSPLHLLMNRASVKGWYSGTSIDSQDTLRFSALAGVRPMNEVFPLERANEAYEHMMSGKARFRVVLTPH